VEMLVKLAAELTHAGQVGELFIRPPGSSAFLDALERSAQKAAAARKGPVESLEAMWERSSRERQEQLSREPHDSAVELREDAILQIWRELPPRQRRLLIEIAKAIKTTLA